MAELRLDPFTRRWVITGKRPVMPDVHDEGGACPFCPGNEHMTPPRHPRVPRLRRRVDGPGVSRSRPACSVVEGGADRRAEGMFDRMNTVGAHEIVVETPVHGMTLAQLPEEHFAHVLELFRDRILDLKQDRRLRYVSRLQGSACALSNAARARLFPGAGNAGLAAIAGN